MERLDRRLLINLDLHQARDSVPLRERLQLLALHKSSD